MHVVVLADTHIRRGSSRRLPPEVYAAVRSADVILHAGDIVVRDVLDDLATYAPVHAVCGNNDHELVGQLPDRLELDLAGVSVAAVHDSGPKQRRAERLNSWFPDADLVVFGHSHIPWNEPGVDGQWLLNPGSPTERRREPQRSFATVELVDGRVVDPMIVRF